MLVLRRRAGEALLIGDHIEIEFLELSSQSVKVGIKAPKEICILRKELQTTKVENQAATQSVKLPGLTDSLPKD